MENKKEIREKVIKCPDCKSTDIMWNENPFKLHLRCICGFDETWSISLLERDRLPPQRIQ